ncbi:hypothetical protein GIB67_031525 [Kingdonia uniflora]|uniref:Glutamine amidotransferase domain-containing protein n=1 Tax=Kingdonia uniflora TaxID=39325 RepID=A0A7J7MNK1_9MAGN|nr:hypothetical protein GIB67_031525 [Kingdonia uniflora]
MKVVGEDMVNKRYALLLACRDSEYVKKIYDGYFNVFVDTFGEEGETWDLFRVVEGKFPDMDELSMYVGFIISGSPFDAFGNESWILDLCSLLKKLDFMKKKVLGICFGHQVLCRALGGEVGRASSGWDIGLRKVTMVHDLAPLSFLRNLEDVPPCLSIMECHQDEVYNVPLDAKVIALSDKTHIEMFAIGEHILGIQGHPEYTEDILHDIINRLLNNNSIEKEFAEDAKLRLEISEPDRKSWEKICKSFLKGR